MATRSAISAYAAVLATEGTRRPAAPSNSSTPVIVTRSAGFGSLGGTIRTRSGLVRGWKCDTPVKTNIAARAIRSALSHASTCGHNPVKPARRAAAQLTSMTMSGAIVTLYFELPLFSLASRKRRINVAMTSWSSSSAKCPVSNRWKSRSNRL